MPPVSFIQENPLQLDTFVLVVFYYLIGAYSMTNLDRMKLWNDYIETTRDTGRAMKLDSVLELRMNAFIKARELKLSRVEV